MTRLLNLVRRLILRKKGYFHFPANELPVGQSGKIALFLTRKRKKKTALTENVEFISKNTYLNTRDYPYLVQTTHDSALSSDKYGGQFAKAPSPEHDTDTEYKIDPDQPADIGFDVSDSGWVSTHT